MGLPLDRITEAHVERARTGYEMFRDGDPAVFDLWNPELEWHVPESLPGGGDLVGSMAVLQFLESMRELWEDAYPIPDEFVPAGEKLIVLGIWQGRAKSTGRLFEAPFVHLQKFRDDKLIYFRNYVDSATVMRSLEDAGSD